MQPNRKPSRRRANVPCATTQTGAETILQALRDRGSSLTAWAEARGYAPRSAYHAVKTWGGRTDRAPVGGISRLIMADLRADLGSEIVPEPGRIAA